MSKRAPAPPEAGLRRGATHPAGSRFLNASYALPTRASDRSRCPSGRWYDLACQTLIAVGERGQVAEDPEVQKLLRDAFQSYVRESHERTARLKSRHEVDPDEVVEQLRALGYLK